MIFINNNEFKNKNEALNYINKNIMTEGNFTTFEEAQEYLINNGFDILDGLKCPYCGYIEEESNFPDLFYKDINNTSELNNQYKLLLELNEVNFNIVTCGMCGQVFIQKIKED